MKDKKIKAIIERFLKLSKPKITKPDTSNKEVDSYFRKMLKLDCPPQEMDKVVFLSEEAKEDLSNMDDTQMKEQCRVIASNMSRAIHKTNVNKATMDGSIETLCEVINGLMDRVSELENIIIIKEATMKLIDTKPRRWVRVTENYWRKKVSMDRELKEIQRLLEQHIERYNLDIDSLEQDALFSLKAATEVRTIFTCERCGVQFQTTKLTRTACDFCEKRYGI